jgi:hypothetical protein
MFSLIPTVTIEIGTEVKSLPDSYGDIVFNYIYETVDGCLVAPYSSIERSAPFSLLDETKILVHIPSSFTESLHNARIQYNGVTYKVIGNPVPFSWSPAPWNREVVCEEVPFDE